MRRIETEREVFRALGHGRAPCAPIGKAGDAEWELATKRSEELKTVPQSKAVPRRRLLLPEIAPMKLPQPKPTAVPGRLLPRIEAGLISPGDLLSHHQIRKGREFGGVIDAQGWITTEVKSYREPSPALRGLFGSHIDGWACWTHVRFGKTLRALRETLNTMTSAQRTALSKARHQVRRVKNELLPAQFMHLWAKARRRSCLTDLRGLNDDS